MQSDKVKNAKHFMFCICDSGSQKIPIEICSKLVKLKIIAGLCFIFEPEVFNERTNVDWKLWKQPIAPEKNIQNL